MSFNTTPSSPHVGCLSDILKVALLAMAAVGLAAGLGLWVTDQTELATAAWVAGVLPVLAALCIEIVRSLLKGEVGLDIVAALSMAAALLVGEALAAAVVALMYSGGTFLESFAEGRARREMRDLLSRVARTATRHQNGQLEDIPLDVIDAGDLLLIRQGEVAPVDGTVEAMQAMLDQSALTGEALPVRLSHGMAVMSGSTNAGAAFDLRATARAADSTYAGIVRLVETAQRSKAPMARLAGGGPFARCAVRRADQGREAVGGDGAHQDIDRGQDRHADGRATGDRVDHGDGGAERGRGSLLRRLPRSGVPTSGGPSGRGRRPRARANPAGPDRCDRDTGRRRCRPGGRLQCARRWHRLCRGADGGRGDRGGRTWRWRVILSWQMPFEPASLRCCRRYVAPELTGSCLQRVTATMWQRP